MASDLNVSKIRIVKELAAKGTFIADSARCQLSDGIYNLARCPDYTAIEVQIVLLIL